VDWNKIKAEYIAGGTSYRKLAEKYGIDRNKIQVRATKENWVSLKSQAQAKTESKMVDSISDKEATKATNIIDVADKLIGKICEMLDSDVTNAQSIKSLTSALKDLKEIKGYKSDADMREQEARIAKLQKEAQVEAQDKDITIVFGSETEDYSL
jgi:hypothetical protein